VNATVAAIVLAAGASGRLGQPKQLLLHDGETLIARAIRLAHHAGAAPLFVVLGAEHERIGDAIAMSHAMIVVNENWEQGIASSIHAGIEALAAAAPDAKGALILACDQIHLTVDHLRTLIETFAAQTEPAIIASSYAGVLGIPAIFPHQAFANLLTLSGDKGARSLLMNPPCPLIAVPFAGGEADIDTPADLAQLE
jgi:molybdenum cofactor cytidylyltransferase